MHPADPRLAIMARAIRRFNQNRVPEASAAISFYAIFSLFPILIFIVTAASLLFDRAVVEARFLEAIESTFPVSSEFILDLIEGMLETRAAVNFVALVVLVWSASHVFNMVLVNLNRAWDSYNAITFIKSRLVAIGMILSLAVVVILSFFIPVLINLIHLPRLEFEERLLLTISPILLRFFFIYGLYRVGPVIKAKTKTVVLGALAVSLVMEVFTKIFTWYLNSSFSNFAILYGPLEATISLLIWVYLANWILLFGAYLMEAIEHQLAANTQRDTRTA